MDSWKRRPSERHDSGAVEHEGFLRTPPSDATVPDHGVVGRDDMAGSGNAEGLPRGAAVPDYAVVGRNVVISGGAAVPGVVVVGRDNVALSGNTKKPISIAQWIAVGRDNVALSGNMEKPISIMR